jgi:hypothetical protein
MTISFRPTFSNSRQKTKETTTRPSSHKGQAAISTTTHPPTTPPPFLFPTKQARKDVPSKGEKPPLRISSKSQSCLSVSTIAGKVSASASSSFRRGASREIRSLRIPPVNCQFQGFLFESSRRLTMRWVGHCELRMLPNLDLRERLQESISLHKNGRTSLLSFQANNPSDTISRHSSVS